MRAQDVRVAGCPAVARENPPGPEGERHEATGQRNGVRARRAAVVRERLDDAAGVVTPAGHPGCLDPGAHPSSLQAEGDTQVATRDAPRGAVCGERRTPARDEG